MSSTGFNVVDLLRQPTATSFAVSPDYPALVIIAAVMLLTVVTVALALHQLSRRPWTPSTPSQSPPPYKLRALHAGLQLLDLPGDKTASTTLRTTEGIQPLPDIAAARPITVPSSDVPQRAHTLSTHPSSASAPGSPRAAGVDALRPILVTSAPIPLEAADGCTDIYMHELSANQHTQTLDGFDLGSATSVLQETKAAVSSFFQAQSASFSAFVDATQLQLDHVKQLLAVKLHVSLNKAQHGFLDSIDRLISGELLARQSSRDMHRRMEDALAKELEELVTALRNLSDSYEVFPIKHLMKAITHIIDRIELLHRTERSRRKHLAAYTPIIGRRVVDALAQLDLVEEPLVDAFVAALLFFRASSDEILQRLVVEEANHANAMEKIDESNTTRKDYEQDRYHLQLMKTLRDLQTQLSYLDEKTAPLHHQLRSAEQNAALVWAYVQGPLFEERCTEIEAAGKGAGGLWRGVNSELAKVLSGLLGMQGGLQWMDGKWHSARRFDAMDPFCPIFDPGFLPELDEKPKDGSARKSKRKTTDKDHRRDDKATPVTDSDAEKEEPSTTAAEEAPEKKMVEGLPLSSVTLAELPPLEPPPAGLLSPFVASHSLLLSTLLHQRNAVQRQATWSSAQRQAALVKVDAQLTELLHEWGGEVVEVLSAWRAAREADVRRGSLQTVHEHYQQSMDQLRALLDQVSQARERHAGETQALEAELLLEGEEEQQALSDQAQVAAMIERARERPKGRESEVQRRVRQLVEQGISDPAMLAVMMMEQGEKSRAQRMADLAQRQAQELVDLQHSTRSLTDEVDHEALLRQRLDDVQRNDEAVHRQQDELQDDRPELVTVAYTAMQGEPRRATLLRGDRTRLSTVEEEDEEQSSESEAARDRDLEELQALRGQLSDEDWAARREALRARHETERAEEERAHREHVQRLVDELSSRATAQMRDYDAASAEQRTALLNEERQREVALLARWEANKGGRAVGAVVQALMRGRQQRELEALMDRLAHDRAASLTRAIELRRQAGLSVDVPALQRAVRHGAGQTERSALRQLESQHRAELRAAFERCGGQPGDEPKVDLRYDEVENRAAAIAECMDQALADDAADREARRRSILENDQMTDEEKAAAIQGLLASLNSLDERVAREQQKQNAEMRRKLEEQQRKKKEQELLKAKGEHGEKDELAQATLRAHQQQQNVAQQVTVAPAAASPVAPAVSADLGTQEQLIRIERLVQALHADALAWREGAYTDEADSSDPRFIGQQRLTVLTPQQLTPAQAFLQRFGQALLQQLHASRPVHHPSSQSPAVPSLLLASSLPVPTHGCCAYRHVLSYDGAAHGLCIRVERAEDAGRFLASVVHGAAHVRTEAEVRRDVRRRALKAARARSQSASEEKAATEAAGVAVEEENLRWMREEAADVERCWDDRDSRFQRQLQRLQATVLADWFYSAASQQSNVNALTAPLIPEDNSEQPTLADAATAGASALLLTAHPHAGSPTAPPSVSPALYSHLPTFSASRVAARLERYSAFSQQSELLSYLADLERQVHARDLERHSQLHDRLLRVDPTARPPHAHWKTTAQGEGTVEDDELGNAEDELNARLGDVLQLCWSLRADVERGQRELAEVGDTEGRQVKERAMAEARWRLSGLLSEKDDIVARLRHCHSAQQQRTTLTAPG